jgi:hypothetical protein
MLPLVRTFKSEFMILTESNVLFFTNHHYMFIHPGLSSPNIWLAEGSQLPNNVEKWYDPLLPPDYEVSLKIVVCLKDKEDIYKLEITLLNTVK